MCTETIHGSVECGVVIATVHCWSMCTSLEYNFGLQSLLTGSVRLKNGAMGDIYRHSRFVLKEKSLRISQVYALSLNVAL